MMRSSYGLNNCLEEAHPMYYQAQWCLCGMYFALRSRQEHRDLQFNQIKILAINRKKCIQYTENYSKNNCRGLKHRKIEPKVVTHYENLSNPLHCFVKLLELYYSHCPPPEQRKQNHFT